MNLVLNCLYFVITLTIYLHYNEKRNAMHQIEVVREIIEKYGIVRHEFRLKLTSTYTSEQKHLKKINIDLKL